MAHNLKISTSSLIKFFFYKFTNGSHHFCFSYDEMRLSRHVLSYLFLSLLKDICLVIIITQLPLQCFPMHYECLYLRDSCINKNLWTGLYTDTKQRPTSTERRQDTCPHSLLKTPHRCRANYSYAAGWGLGGGGRARIVVRTEI